MDQNAVYSRRWLILGVLCLSLVIVQLDNLVLNLALPTIQDKLDASSSELQWIVDAYTLVFASLLFTSGSLGGPLGAQAGAYGRSCDLRGGLGLRRLLRQHGDTDLLPGGDGGRRGANTARHAVDHQQRLPAAGERQGHRDLGRNVRALYPARTGDRRPSPGAFLVGLRVRDKRPRRGRGSGARPDTSTRVQGRQRPPGPTYPECYSRSPDSG